MGTLRMIGTEAERFVCGHGHPQRELLCQIPLPHDGELFLYQGALYRKPEDVETETFNPRLVAANLSRVVGLEMVRYSIAPLVDFTGPLHAYGSCRHCAPVRAAGDYGVQEFTPWLEYEVTFDRGLFQEIRLVRAQTREQLESELVSRGMHLISSDSKLEPLMS